MLYSTHFHSPVGGIVLTASEQSLTGLWIAGQKYSGAAGREIFVEKNDHPVLAAAREWLTGYFAGKRPSPAGLPLAPEGGEFRQTVWRLLLEIPYGETVTYGELAKETARLLGRNAMSAQAVGGAVGHNPVSIVIPCHRVVGAHGNLTGYAGGLDIKIKLLEHEGADMTAFFRPKKGTAL